MKNELPPIPNGIKALQSVTAAVLGAIGMNLWAQNTLLKVTLFILIFISVYTIIGMLYLKSRKPKQILTFTTKAYLKVRIINNNQEKT